MKIDWTNQGGTKVVRLQGLLTGDETASLCAQIQNAFDSGGGEIIIDMSGVPFIDSRGLEALLDLAERQIRDGRNLKLAGVRPVIQEVLELTELDGLFRFSPDLQTAIGGQP